MPARSVLPAPFVALLLAVLAQAAPAEDKPLEVTTVISNVRKAVGYESLTNRTRDLQLEGRAKHHGLDASYRLVFSNRGQFQRRLRGRWLEVESFDGKTGWGVDWSGTPRVLLMEDLETAQLIPWLQSGFWLRDDGPFRLEVVPQRTNEHHACLNLKLKQGLLEAQLLIDRGTWLPASLTRRGIAGPERWEFHDYRPVNGVTLPHRILHQRAGLTDWFAVDNVQELAAGPGDRYRPNLRRPQDTRFDPGASPRVPLKRERTGHWFVRPKINGQDAGWFALDSGSGAGMTIARAVADRLQLPSFGEVLRVGAGKPVVAPMRHGDTFELGPMTIRSTTYGQLPDDFVNTMKNLGVEFAGTCGYDLFSRAVATLDSKEQFIELHEPEKYRLPAGRWEELALHNKIPCVRCQLDGREEWFRLDTGAGGGMVLLHTPAVERLRLLPGRQTREISVGGVGGNVRALLGRLDSFMVGGRRFEAPSALFVTSQEGALNDACTAGTFGGEFLMPFQVVFDYSRQRIAFVEK